MPQRLVSNGTLRPHRTTYTHMYTAQSPTRDDNYRTNLEVGTLFRGCRNSIEYFYSKSERTLLSHVVGAVASSRDRREQSRERSLHRNRGKGILLGAMLNAAELATYPLSRVICQRVSLYVCFSVAFLLVTLDRSSTRISESRTDASRPSTTSPAPSPLSTRP